MNAGGEITGTPNAAFNGNITVTVTDSSNPQQSAQVPLALVVNQATTTSNTGGGGGNGVDYFPPAVQTEAASSITAAIRRPQR